MSSYLYGIVRRAGPAAPDGGKSKKDAAARLTPRSIGPGVGDPPAPVALVRHRDVAALVSEVDEGQIGEAAGVRGLRRDMAAHADLLNRLLTITTVLPVRFGVILPGPDAVVDYVLAPHYQRLRDDLDRLEGAVELSVRATYIEEAVLKEVVREQPRLAQPLQAGRGRRSGLAYDSRIEAGRRIAAALREKRDRDQQWLVGRLRPFAQEVSVSQPASDLMVLHASFLVRRDRLDRFDRALEEVNAEVADVIGLNCVGPLPPYSFVAVSLPAGQ